MEQMEASLLKQTTTFYFREKTQINSVDKELKKLLENLNFLHRFAL